MPTAETRLSLDMADIHVVTARRGREQGTAELTLGPPTGDRRSVVHEALARQLRVRGAPSGALHRFDDVGRKLVVREDSTAELVLFDEGEAKPPLAISTLDVQSLAWKRGSYRLSPFELRYAADTGRIHSIPLAARSPAHRIETPVTDLHSHFAACVRGDELVRLGAEAKVVYPSALIAEAKIHLDGDVRIAELAPPLRDRLARRLEIPLDRCVTFLDMERVYRLRTPFTRPLSMIIPLCREIAADYAAMGIEYVELSFGGAVETEVLRALHQELPRIEQETGVTMRFLAAISRHDDPEWDEDLVERIKKLAGSVYIAGVDFMGHETNSTRVFAPVIRALTAWADEARPGFVIRVHAGESPSHPENVRVTLDEVRGHNVDLRIGHGLFGVDDATLEQIVKMDVIVEFNLDSNVALNHLQSARHVPLRRYVDAGAHRARK